MHGKDKYFIRYKQGNGIPENKNLSTFFEKNKNTNLQQMNKL
jgi:hypothetical protein